MLSSNCYMPLVNLNSKYHTNQITSKHRVLYLALYDPPTHSSQQHYSHILR